MQISLVLFVQYWFSFFLWQARQYTTTVYSMTFLCTVHYQSSYWFICTSVFNLLTETVQKQTKAKKRYICNYWSEKSLILWLNILVTILCELIIKEYLKKKNNYFPQKNEYQFLTDFKSRESTSPERKRTTRQSIYPHRRWWAEAKWGQRMGRRGERRTEDGDQRLKEDRWVQAEARGGQRMVSRGQRRPEEDIGRWSEPEEDRGWWTEAKGGQMMASRDQRRTEYGEQRPEEDRGWWW